LPSLSSSEDREREKERGGNITVDFTHNRKARVYGSIKDPLPMDLNLAPPKNQRYCNATILSLRVFPVYRVGKEWSHAVDLSRGCAALVLCFEVAAVVVGFSPSPPAFLTNAYSPQPAPFLSCYSYLN
jgi:hypothetical protein